MGQGGLGGEAAGAVQHLVGDAALLQDAGVLGDVVHLFLGAEELEGAALAVVVGEGGVGAEGFQAVTGVFGEADHAALVHVVGGFGAVAQHQGHPVPHKRVEQRADDQGAVGHHHPSDGLERDAGTGPGGGVAGRNLAGVGEAGFHAGGGLAVEHGDLVAGPVQVPGGGGADDAGAEDDDFHALSAFGRWSPSDKVTGR